MDNNENNVLHFNILEYINSKLDNTNYEKDLVIICLNVDNNNEPYIEVTYVDEEGNEAGLNKNFDQLSAMADVATEYSYFFEISIPDCIVPIIYDSGTQNLNLIKSRNGNYIGNKFLDDFENAIFVGYIINQELNLDFKQKVLELYNIMKKMMYVSYNTDNAAFIIFKVCDKELNNIWFIKDWRLGYRVNEHNDNIFNNENISIIESELMEKNFQNVKK